MQSTKLELTQVGDLLRKRDFNYLIELDATTQVVVLPGSLANPSKRLKKNLEKIAAEEDIYTMNLFRDDVDKKQYDDMLKALENINKNAKKLVALMSDLCNNPKNFSFPQWIYADKPSMVITKLIFSKFSIKLCDKHNIKEEIKAIIEKKPLEFLRDYKKSYTLQNKRSDEYRKQILSHFLSYLEREFYEKELPPGSERLQIYDKRISFLKFYRKRELDRQSLPSFNTVETWYSKIFGAKNKATLSYIDYIFQNFPEIRHRLVRFIKHFVRSKRKRRHIDIVRCLSGIALKDINWKEFKSEQLIHFGIHIIHNTKFKFVWTTFLLGEATKHFKDRCVQICIKMVFFDELSPERFAKSGYRDRVHPLGREDDNLPDYWLNRDILVDLKALMVEDAPTINRCKGFLRRAVRKFKKLSFKIAAGDDPLEFPQDQTFEEFVEWLRRFYAKMETIHRHLMEQIEILRRSTNNLPQLEVLKTEAIVHEEETFERYLRQVLFDIRVYVYNDRAGLKLTPQMKFSAAPISETSRYGVDEGRAVGGDFRESGMDSRGEGVVGGFGSLDKAEREEKKKELAELQKEVVLVERGSGGTLNLKAKSESGVLNRIAEARELTPVLKVGGGGDNFERIGKVEKVEETVVKVEGAVETDGAPGDDEALVVVDEKNEQIKVENVDTRSAQ